MADLIRTWARELLDLLHLVAKADHIALKLKLSSKVKILKEQAAEKDTSIKLLKELNRRQKETIENLSDEVSKWKKMARLAGTPGLEAPDRKLVVAGPYFCDSSQFECVKTAFRELFSSVPYYADKAPNQAQWNMVLSENPLTCINAGAGSGKSTMLVLRIFVLTELLKVPWKEISVFTFTKNSRHSLIEKLITTYGRLGVEVSENTAKQVIRTFHSYALLFHWRKTGGGSESVFELSEAGNGPTRAAEHRLEVASGGQEVQQVDLDEPEFDVEKSFYPALQDDDEKRESSNIDVMLKEVYHQAFGQSPEFRAYIQKLYYMSERILKNTVFDPPSVGFIQDNDKEATEVMSRQVKTTKELS
jgi:hypothetical protein